MSNDALKLLVAIGNLCKWGPDKVVTHNMIMNAGIDLGFGQEGTIGIIHELMQNDYLESLDNENYSISHLGVDKAYPLRTINSIS